MSVFINGMEMPKSCMLCNFCVPEADEANGEMCMVTGKLMPPCNHERLDDCPLLPVQPHGDLIDRDALVKCLATLLRFPSNLVNEQWIVNTLREQPTIVPAEEGET